MPDFDKILPLVLIALWYIFKGGKKKVKKDVSEQYDAYKDQAQQTQATSRTQEKKPTNLQDILEELMGEEKAVQEPVNPYKDLRVEQKRQARTTKVESDSLETLNPIRENLETKKRNAEIEKKRRDIIAAYDAAEGDTQEDEKETDFDLRQAVIHQVILDTPYIK